MSSATNLPPDVRPIRSLIRSTARLLRSSWITTGMGLTLGLGLGMLALLSLLDLALPLDPVLRLLALILVIVPAAWAFVTGVVRPIFRRLRPVQVARRIEAHLPGIHNRLVSCIDLENARARNESPQSPEFYRRLVQEAIERIRGFRPYRVIDGRSLRRALLFAATSILAFGLAFGLFSDRFPTALARIFSPFADIPPASGVVYSVEPGNAKVLRGEQVTFHARVERGDPDRLQLEIEPDGGGRPVKYDLEKIDPALWSFTSSGFETSFHYRVRGGGTWSRRMRLTVVDRPSIVGLSTLLHYPEYMGMPERRGVPQMTEVSGPVGSTVEVAVESEGDVATAEIQLLATRPVRVAVADRPERIWYQERLPDGAGTEGAWDWDFRLLARPAHTEPAAAGVHGHRFAGAQVPFELHPNDDLFAYVYIDPKDKPEAIMVSWHDGSDWDHRAFWGEDQFTEGKAGSPSRMRIGPLPAAGEWTRLEVPATAVDLGGKTIRGMGFALSGGRCYWHRAGALPPAHVERPELYVQSTMPMGPAGTHLWTGNFPLERDTLYRVELKNELGHPSKPMKEAKATAIVDEPPQVVLDRPGSDIVLSTPVKVPLSIAAYDDFGLADLVVSVQRGDRGGFIGRPVHHFDHPERSSSFTTSLDVPALKLKPGEFLRYRVEARDRKGQSAQTQEYVIRIADDGNAADRQLENFDRNQESLRQNLERLIADQAKVNAAIKQAPTDLVSLRREAGQLASKEEQNAALAEQIAGALKQTAEQAAELKMLPGEMLRQVEDINQEFRAGVMQPLKDVAGDLKRGADEKQPAPEAAALARDTDRIQQQLEAVRDQLDAASRARKELPRDAGAALAGLRENALRANAGLAEHALEELQGSIQAGEEELKGVEKQQTDLAEATPKAPEVLLPDLERRQGELEPREDRALEDARALLEAAKAGQENSADAANKPDAAARQDQAEPADGDNAALKNAPKAEPAEQGQEDRRGSLGTRQHQRLEKLATAHGALERENQALEKVLERFRQGKPGQPQDAAELERMMRSAEVRRALDMAHRSRELAEARRHPARGQTASFTKRPDQFPTTDKMVAPLENALPDIDLATRNAILKLQPQIREELLQGLREEGPEGYRGFIRNYFKKLTEIKGNP